MTPAVEQVLTQVRALSPAEQQQLREALLLDQPAATEQAERLAKISAFRGKYKHLFSSTDELMARKREEVALEERRYQPTQQAAETQP
jgi:hypothetical protein